MRLLANLPIRQKIILSLSILVLVMGSFMAIALGMFHQLTENEKKLYKQYEENVHSLNELSESFLLARVWLRDFYIFSEIKDELKITQASHQFQHFAVAMEKAKDKYITFKKNIEFHTHSDPQTFINGIEEDYKSFENVAVAIYQHIKTGDFSTASNMIGEDCYRTAEKLIERIHTVYEAEDQFIETNLQKIENTIQTLMITSIGVGLALLGLCFLIFTSLDKLIVKPIAEASRHFAAMAKGEWDLSKKINIDQKDEIGVLFASLNTFVDVLRNLIDKVMSSSQNIATESTSLNNLSQDTCHDLNDQHQLTDRVAVSIEEMTGSVKEVAVNADSAAKAASTAKNQSDNIATTLDTTIQSVSNLGDQIQSSSSVINQLRSESDNISKVLDVIKGIAEQTNLLALNAAIEAARAGEQGRGFAVVADEVRTLAQRTQGSTSEIEKLISDLQSGSASAVKAMDKSQQGTDQVIKQANEIRAAMREILQSIVVISDMNSQIAVATEQQSAAVQEVSKNVQDIKIISGKNTESAEATSHSSVALNKLSIELEEQLVQFKH